jgi:hypothetical protein
MPELSIVSYEPPVPDATAGSKPDIPGLLDQKADQYGVPRSLVHTVAQIESNFNPGAVSGKGAVGLMQLMPATARALGVKDLSDPEQNADGGVRLLSQLIDKYGGSTRHVLAAYNAGEPAVDRAGGVPNFPETQRYVAKGMKSLPENLSAGGNAPAAPAAPVAAPAAAPAPAPAAADPYSRIAAGEELTPELLQQIMRPQPAPAPAAPSAAAPLTITNFEPYQAPTPPASITDALKHEDFLHSAWNALISPFTATKSILTGEYGQATHQQLQQAAQLQKSGTPEEKRAFARDVLLQNIPFASTIYKAFQGNLPGAAGDVAGFAAIPVAAKVLPAAGGAIKTGVGAAVDAARSPVTSDVLGVVSPRAANALRVFRRGANAVESVQEAIAAGTPAAEAPAATPTPAAAAAKTPGQAYAESQGHDWAKLSANDRQILEQIAQAQANVAAQAPAEPPTTPSVTPPAAPAVPQEPAAGSAAPAPAPQATPAVEDPLQWTRAEIIDRGGQLPAVSEIQRRFKMGYGAASDVLRAAQREPPTTPPATPPAAPAAPEAPAAPQEPAAGPIAPAAPATLQPAAQATVQSLTDYAIRKQIPPGFFGELGPEEWRMIADDAGTQVPTPDQIAQIKQNVAAKAVETPAQGEQVFQTQKARIEEGMTPPAAPPAGVILQPLPGEIPAHYQRIQQVEGTSAATRAFLKDQRIADYLLGKGITPEEFEAMPLAEQNKLVVEAPAASKKGKHLPFLPKPEGAAPRAVGRYAEEGIKDIADTMRWRQAQQPAAPVKARPPITDFNRP